MKKRILALFCALGLLLALGLPAARAANTVYILAVNDKFCDLPNGALPVSVNGTIYVPYTVFDKNATGVDLGVYYGIGLTRGTTISLYSQSPDILVFSLGMGICQDGEGNTMNFRATTKNSIPYLPAAAVCEFFGLNYSFLPTANRGTLIRISNSAVTMSDSQFLSTGAQAMSTRYNNILRSMGLTEDPLPTPSAAPTPTPTPGGSKSDVRVYPAVDASDATIDLAGAFPAGTRGLVLFSPASLAAQSALVRKVVSAGHSIGLKLDGAEADPLSELERGNELLAHIARTRTRIVSAPDSLSAALTEAGWTLWESNVREGSAAATLAGVDAKRTVARVDLPVSAVSRVMSQLVKDGYDLRQPLETDL